MAALCLAGAAACAAPAPDGSGAAPPDSTGTFAVDTQPTGAQGVTPDAWAQAGASIRHLTIDSFPSMPVAARRAFAADGCEVPQAFHPAERHNVVSGEFAAPGQLDWAALCGRADSAEIVIAWGGPSRCPTPLARTAKRDQLQLVSGNRIGYSRLIDTAPIDMIERLATAFGGPAQPSSDHAGITDAFVDKASIIHYCHAGRWHTLPGID